jgi:hypothetical protein
MQEDGGNEQMRTSTGAEVSTPIVIDDQVPRTHQKEPNRLQESLRRAEERRHEATVPQQESTGVGEAQASIQLSISSNGTADIVQRGSHQQVTRQGQSINSPFQGPVPTKPPSPGLDQTTQQQPQQTKSLFVRSPTSGFLRLADDVTMEDIEMLEANELAGGG